jgi:hypothetical protein
MGTRPNEIPHSGELGELAFLNRDAVPSLTDGYTKAEADDKFLTDEVIGTEPDQVPLVGMLARRAFTDGPIGTADIANAAITTEKIAPSAVVTEDLADAAVTTAKIADSAVTSTKVGESLIRLGTQQATTSGVFKEFSGIPSWARRITLNLWYVSTNGAANILVQLGTGGAPTTSGYAGYSVFSWASGVVPVSSTAGIPIFNNAASYSHFGQLNFDNIGGNAWVASGHVVTGGTQGSTISGGFVELAGVLNYLRIVTANGTDAFDAGAVNISWN